MIANSALLNLVIALHCEAKPIIEYCHLKKIHHQHFPIFSNENKTLNLIISGVGKIKVGMATTFLQMWSGNKFFACFMNVGIAGGTNWPIGQFLLANKITEKSTGRNWFPYTTSMKNKIQASLLTYDEPQSQYCEDNMMDMEGSAFFQSASHFVTQEHIQVCKIIADHDEQTRRQLNEKNVSELIKINITDILAIMNDLTTLSQQELVLLRPNEYEEIFLHNWRFTVTQSIQIQELLRKWQNLFSQESPFEFCKNSKNGNDVIVNLSKKLDIHENSLY